MNYSTAKLYEELPSEDRERVDELIKTVHRDEATDFVGPQGPTMSAFVAMVGTQVRAAITYTPNCSRGRELVTGAGWGRNGLNGHNRKRQGLMGKGQSDVNFLHSSCVDPLCLCGRWWRC